MGYHKYNSTVRFVEFLLLIFEFFIEKTSNVTQQTMLPIDHQRMLCRNVRIRAIVEQCLVTMFDLEQCPINAPFPCSHLSKRRNKKKKQRTGSKVVRTIVRNRNVVCSMLEHVLANSTAVYVSECGNRIKCLDALPVFFDTTKSTRLS